MQPFEPFLKGTLHKEKFSLRNHMDGVGGVGRLATMRGFFFCGQIFDAGTSTKSARKKAKRNALRSNEARYSSPRPP